MNLIDRLNVAAAKHSHGPVDVPMYWEEIRDVLHLVTRTQFVQIAAYDHTICALDGTGKVWFLQNNEWHLATMVREEAIK